MKFRGALASILFLAYPGAVHWSLLSGRSDLAVLALLLVCVSFAALFVSYAGRLSTVSAAVIAVVSVTLTATLMQGSSFPVVLFPLVLNMALCWMFGRTLGQGREALITRFARLIENGDPPLEVVRYTRRLTLVWCLVFSAFAVELALLALLADPAVWSLFANVINYLLVIVVFVVEYGYRRWRFRHRSHLSPLQFLTSLAKADWRQLSLR